LAEKLINDQSGWPRWWVLLVDPKRKMEAEEAELLNWIGMEPLLFLWSKADRFSNNQRAKLVKDNAWKSALDVSVMDPIWISSKKGTGLHQVNKALKNFVANSHVELP
jgi:GTP-binding protein EngB required for normal cell division